MKQIEHLPAVVLCATLVLPCLTLRPREIRSRRTRPPWRGWMQSKPGERSRPGCASCRSFRRARRVASSSFEVIQGQRHDDET